MADLAHLDQTYHFILERFVETGQAPHYTDIARNFSISPDEGKQRLYDLMEVALPNWLYPGTDLIASFAPFNNQPTHYRVSVDGEQKWFAQCGLESLAISWLFPGKSVQVDAPCLDCGELIRIVMREGTIEAAEPDGVCFYVSLPVREWYSDLPFA